jgi:hypothetical protein
MLSQRYVRIQVFWDMMLSPIETSHAARPATPRRIWKAWILTRPCLTYTNTVHFYAYFWRQVSTTVEYKTRHTFTQRSCDTHVVVTYLPEYSPSVTCKGRFQWRRSLMCGSAAARLLGLPVRNPLGAWMSASCECCVLSGTNLCVGPITRPAESYQMWCVWV